MKSVALIGIAWYLEEDYQEIRNTMSDGRNLPETYRDWIMMATATEAGFEARGVRVVRAAVRPAEFTAWCAQHGFKADSKGRIEFASRVARNSASTP